MQFLPTDEDDDSGNQQNGKKMEIRRYQIRNQNYSGSYHLQIEMLRNDTRIFSCRPHIIPTNYRNDHSRLIKRRNRSLKNRGYVVSYLALGFLEWKESIQSNDIRKAPLILIPVEMDREGVKRSFKINWTKEDILTNISLKAKLKEFGIKLPDFEMPDNKAEIYDYFQLVKESISSMEGWDVHNDIYLGFFSFTKFVMYQDLDLDNWPEEFLNHDNTLINQLFDPSSEVSNDNSFNEEDVDKKLTAANSYTVLDADSSQIAVIEEAKSHKNLVVEGPPGTGKSQTIVNLITELIGAGRSVLFVSEKMAALDVVKDRLDRVGMGDFCLELHSRHSNKKEILNELEKTLIKSKTITNIDMGRYTEIDLLKSRLDQYNTDLHKPIRSDAVLSIRTIRIERRSNNTFSE